MPDQDVMTLGRFFFGHRPPESDIGGELGSGQLDELREAMQSELGKTRWKPVATELGKQIAALLDFGVAEKILAPTWQRLEVLQEYRDSELHPPEETSLVPLVEHSVQSTHRPHLDLLIKDVEIGRLTLAVDLALDLEGIVLRVRDGRMLGVMGGSVAGRGSLVCSYGEKTVYSLERESRKFSVETEVAFGDGIPIPPLDVEPDAEATPPPEDEP